MERIILISLMILAICIVGGEEKSQETSINTGEIQIEVNDKETPINSSAIQNGINNNEKNTLVGRTFKISIEREPELNDCKFSFGEEDVSYYDGFSMSYKGNYEINDDTIDITLLSHNNEYSPTEQSIIIKIQLKILDKDKLEVLETPDSFILKTSISGPNGWEYDGGEKEITLSGVKQGFQFTEVESFEERTKEARDYMNKTYDFSLTPSWCEPDCSQQNLIESASLEKKEDYYILKLNFVVPKIYDKREIVNAYNIAQENGSYSFDEYTFYKDNKLLLENDNFENDYFKEGDILATKEGEPYFFYCFSPIPDDVEKYYVSWSDIFSRGLVYELDKELEVVLLPNDRMTITFDRDLDVNVGEELTVEEYYQKAINNDGDEYKLDSVGNSVLPWNDTNAVNFENGSVNVNYHTGGI